MCIEQDRTCLRLFRFWNIRDVPKYRTMSFWHPRIFCLFLHHNPQPRQRGWHPLDHSKNQVRNPRTERSEYLAVFRRVDAVLVVHEIRNNFESDWNWLISDEGLSHFMFIQSCDIDTENINYIIFQLNSWVFYNLLFCCNKNSGKFSDESEYLIETLVKSYLPMTSRTVFDSS